VDTWLASKFRDCRRVPEFERNSSTLKVLLAVAGINEGADESRKLMAHADQAARCDRNNADLSREDPEHNHRPHLGCTYAIRDELLSTICDSLNRTGETALDALGDVAIQLGTSIPDLEDLGNQFIAWDIILLDTSNAVLRTDIWRDFLAREIQTTMDSLTAMRSTSHQLPPQIAKQNMDLQRKTKAVVAQLTNAQERLSVPSSTIHKYPPSIQHVVREEEQFLDILSHKKELDAQMMVFDGLPSDASKVRDEIEALRHKLRRFTSLRDQVFEGLVERASPVKHR
jgi:HAUS augmin-like complex subunit 1